MKTGPTSHSTRDYDSDHRFLDSFAIIWKFSDRSPPIGSLTVCFEVQATYISVRLNMLQGTCPDKYASDHSRSEWKDNWWNKDHRCSNVIERDIYVLRYLSCLAPKAVAWLALSSAYWIQDLHSFIFVSYLVSVGSPQWSQPIQSVSRLLGPSIFLYG